jgi:CBS domain-containing protein
MESQTKGLVDQHVPYSRLTPEQLAWLEDRLVLRDYRRGDALLLPGSMPQRMFFIVNGTVRLEAMGKVSEADRVLAEVVEGESFPVEALREERPVFSTFRAHTDVRCLELPVDDFHELRRVSAEFDEFCRQRSTAFFQQSRRIYHTHFAAASPSTHLASPLRGLIRGDPARCSPTEPLAKVLQRMERDGLELIAVVDDARQPLGTFSLADFLTAYNAGRADSAGPVGDLMSVDTISLQAEALGFEAALLMAERGLSHALVTDGPKLVAVVAERDLFALQSVGISQLAVEIRNAKDQAGLVACSRNIKMLASNFLGQGVAPNQLTRIVSTLNGRLTGRAIELELARRDLGDIRFCWIALGSEGRLEQTLHTDQDNAIIFAAADGDEAERLRRRLLPLAHAVNATLQECGFPLCKGGIMAGNPQLCLSLEEWHDRFSGWLREPDPEALLNASIYFDLRPIWGDTLLAERLLNWLAAGTSSNTRFLHLMTENARRREPPLGFFRDFVVDSEGEHPDTLDIKLAGITLFVDAARVLGLASGVTDSNTERRLRLAAERSGLPQGDVEAWVDAFNFMQGLRLRHQYALVSRGEPAHNRINPYALNQLDRKFFLEALRQAGLLQKYFSSRLDAGM